MTLSDGNGLIEVDLPDPSVYPLNLHFAQERVRWEHGENYEIVSIQNDRTE